MDAYEATRVVFSRIQNLDPENASKIMGILLIQDHGEKEMIRLAFGPETLVHSVILKARKELGLQIPNSPCLSSPSTPLSPSPFLSRQNSSSSRLANGFSLPSPLSIPNSSTSAWTNFSHVQNQNQDEQLFSPSLPLGSSSSLPFYGASNNNNSNDMMGEFQLQDQLSFLNDNNQDLASSPTGVVDSMLHPQPYNWGEGSVHRRSASVSDACFGTDDPNGGGYGWKPCMYYARGYCKNGSSCRFLHGGLVESMVGSDGVHAGVGSPNKLDLMDQCPELVRSRRLAAASQLMASSLPYSPKGMNFLLQQQQNDSQRAATAFMINEDLHKFGRSRLDRNEMMNPASRQIYLTFPADSTFREEDVTNYFSIYGPVEDVRIPYQQKRMFGFVTFVYPETVKIILAKGNPHFVCDARVLVKPYKEKGKVMDKKQSQHQMERGEFSPCGTPTGMDSRDPFDLQLGSRMFYNAQDILWRRKLEEQADLQQALELQSRRLMNLQLLDIKKHHHLRTLSTGSPVGSPTQSTNYFNQNINLPSFNANPEVLEESHFGSKMVNATNNAADQNWQKAVNATAGKEGTDKFGNGYFKESQPNKDSDLQENLEHNLPENLFASPTKASSEFLSAFSNPTPDPDKESARLVTSTPSCEINGTSDNSSMPSASSPLEVSSFKSFNCQLPRFSSGHGAIGMSGGTGGPTCPVGI